MSYSGQIIPVNANRTPLFARKVPGGALVITDETNGTGSKFFVHSSTGTDAAGYGVSPDRPVATLDYAVGLCTANKNDTIYVMPGHAETLTAAAGVDLDVAGITVIGLGNGSNRPTFTLGTVVGTDVDVDADNVTIKNLRFISNINDLTTVIDDNSNNTTIEDCEFVSSSLKEAVCFVDKATTKDGLYVRRCRFFQPTDPEGTDGGAGSGCFYFVDSEDLIFEDCFFYGNFETAIWHNKTTAAKNVWIVRCYGTQLLAGGEVTLQVANMEGGVVGSYFTVSGSADAAEANTWGTCSAKFFVDITSSVGNDGGGGQLGVPAASVAS